MPSCDFTVDRYVHRGVACRPGTACRRCAVSLQSRTGSWESAVHVSLLSLLLTTTAAIGCSLCCAAVMHNLSENAKFFDRLVDMVPAKYYHPSDQELVNTKYLKKNAKAVAKQVMKEQYKQNKRAKLNPDTAKTSLQIQQQQVEKLQQSDFSEEDDAAEPDLPQPAQAQKPEPVRTLNLPSGAVCLCASTRAGMQFHTLLHCSGGTPPHTALQEKLQQRLQVCQHCHLQQLKCISPCSTCHITCTDVTRRAPC